MSQEIEARVCTAARIPPCLADDRFCESMLGFLRALFSPTLYRYALREIREPAVRKGHRRPEKTSLAQRNECRSTTSPPGPSPAMLASGSPPLAHPPAPRDLSPTWPDAYGRRPTRPRHASPPRRLDACSTRRVDRSGVSNELPWACPRIRPLLASPARLVVVGVLVDDGLMPKPHGHFPCKSTVFVVAGPGFEPGAP